MGHVLRRMAELYLFIGQGQQADSERKTKAFVGTLQDKVVISLMEDIGKDSWWSEKVSINISHVNMKPWPKHLTNSNVDQAKMKPSLKAGENITIDLSVAENWEPIRRETPDEHSPIYARIYNINFTFHSQINSVHSINWNEMNQCKQPLSK